MTRSVLRSYQHLVWATFKRQPLLTAQVEPIILASFADTCERLDLALLAANGAWDHVHLLVRWSGEHCYQDVVRELKSRAWRACREAAEEDPLLPGAPRWQRGYAISSIREGEVSTVRRYIQRQKLHHQRPASLCEDLERLADE